MSDSNSRAWVRSQIVPFSAVRQKPAEYETSWAGRQTFEQIYDSLAHYASNVMQRNGIRPYYLPDCLQHGFMALWEALVENTTFLAEKSRKQAVFFILARCRISTLRYYEGRYDSLDALTTDDWHSASDELALTGLEANRDERWAAWATDVDIRLDIEHILCKLAKKYADSFGHLVALYYLTTEVAQKDAAQLVGIPVWDFYRRYSEPLRRELQYEFGEVFLEQHSYTLPEERHPEERAHMGRFTSPYHEWREQYDQGNTTPAEALVEKYQHTICIAGAIRAQLDGKTYRQAALDIGRNPNTFPKYMKRAARMLAAAYA